MVLLPAWSGTEATDQRALVDVPLKLARPMPPRSLIQPTRYRRRLSVAVPVSEVDPDSVLRLAPESIATFGAMRSSDRQRTRSASSRSVLLPACSLSSTTVASSFAPPQPEIAIQATAWATHQADLFI